ncbi:MAG: hypothetical protein J6T89_00940 [Bacteroidales bacterium]|nr:hypothetical protein [Bacteroidales bacterium]
MLKKFKLRWSNFRLSLRMKIIVALSSISVVLLLSSIISILEYRRMSSYVSTLMAQDIRNIHTVEKLMSEADSYNLDVLAVIGDDSLSEVPAFDRQGFRDGCDSLKTAFKGRRIAPLADSVLYAYSAYMLASTELPDIVASTFINTRDWYFTRLQPLFYRLRGYLDKLNEMMYKELQHNASDFDHGFYRSIIPAAVAVSVGILLVFLLLFFILSYYVKPLYRMLEGLRDYRSFRHRYSVEFDGNDQLQDLNTEVSELTDENRQLRRRLANLKQQQEQ